VLSLVVLVSGSGSNLRALCEASQEPGYPARIVAVGADRPAAGLAHAEEFGIPQFTVPFAEFADRREWGGALLTQIESWQPDLVLLSGFMRLLPSDVVKKLSPRILNTHPAFLPEFPGAHGVRDALAAGVTQTGASIIVIDNGVDTGPIIAQERCAVNPDDTEQTLHERIKVIERRLLVQCVRDIADGIIDLKELASA
jgi:phosphoribosylglycinamide formyltransferase 1